MTPSRRSLLKMGAAAVLAPLGWMLGRKASADGWKVTHDLSHNYICFDRHDGWPPKRRLTLALPKTHTFVEYTQAPLVSFSHLGSGVYEGEHDGKRLIAVLTRKDHGKYGVSYKCHSITEAS